MIKNESAIWILLVFALIFPLIPFNQFGIDSAIFQNLVVVFNNVCYGYIAGFIFYIFSDFRQRSYRILKSKQKLAESYRLIHVFFLTIADSLNIIDAEGNIVDNSMQLAESALVKNRNSSHLFILDETIFGKIKACFLMMQDEIDSLLTLYHNILTEEELKDLNTIKAVFGKLHLSSLSAYVASTNISIPDKDFKYFIEEFAINYRKTKRLEVQYSSYMFNAREAGLS